MPTATIYTACLLSANVPYLNLPFSFPDLYLNRSMRYYFTASSFMKHIIIIVQQTGLLLFVCPGMSYNTTEPNSLMEESLKMAKFNHPNVMRLIGVCIDKGPSPYIVMPYMSYGSLLSYLKKQRAELTLANCNNQELASCTFFYLTTEICLQITAWIDKQFLTK